MRKSLSQLQLVFCLLSVFAISSCLFPTGVTTTSFWLATILALILFCSDRQREAVHDSEPLAIFIGYALISYLALVSFATGADIKALVISTFEYRILFLIPLIGILFYGTYQNRCLFLFAFFLGALIALVASYLIYFDILTFEDGRRSLANRIFHGFLMMSLFVFVAGLKLNNKYAGFLLSFFLVVIVYNVLAVETGRTAYICLGFVGFYYLIYGFKTWKSRALGSMLGICLVTLIGIIEPVFVSTVSSSVVNIFVAIMENSYSNSAGLRAEYYRGGFRLWAESPIYGLGLANISQALDRMYNDGLIRVFTDNLHSEYLTMLVGGGALGLIFYCLFLTFLWRAFRMQPLVEINRGISLDVQFVGQGIVLVIAIFSLFNSTFKDFGEKQLLLFMLPLLLQLTKKKDRQ